MTECQHPPNQVTSFAHGAKRCNGCQMVQGVDGLWREIPRGSEVLGR